MKIYYSYLKNDLEKIDKCLAISRQHAANIFSNRKYISLKNYLNIYYVMDNDNMCIYKNKIININSLNEKINYKIVYKKNTLFIERQNDIDNILFPKYIKLYKVPPFIDYIAKEYTINIEKIKNY